MEKKWFFKSRRAVLASNHCQHLPTSLSSSTLKGWHSSLWRSFQCFLWWSRLQYCAWAIMLNSFSLVFHLHTFTFPHLPQAEFPFSPQSRAQRSDSSFASLSAVMARKFVFRINLSISKIILSLILSTSSLPCVQSQRAHMSTCAFFGRLPSERGNEKTEEDAHLWVVFPYGKQRQDKSSSKE